MLEQNTCSEISGQRCHNKLAQFYSAKQKESKNLDKPKNVEGFLLLSKNSNKQKNILWGKKPKKKELLQF